MQKKVRATFTRVLVSVLMLQILFATTISSSIYHASDDGNRSDLTLFRCEIEDPKYHGNFEVEERNSSDMMTDENTGVLEPVVLARDADYIYGTISMTDEEYEMFCRSIETEVTGDMYYKEKMNIAKVILNRVLDDRYPDTIHGVLTAPGQFSYSLTPERYANIKVTETTRQVVKDVFTLGYDDTQGALYFCSGDIYFNRWADYIFTDDVGHRFYKN